ncbi:MAG: hypothetical protein GFH27_549411n4 [Chloroflexi bacterium AL-W]|nr:hypothetical protein [Chloroflexi bacterium AL-W]
METLLSSLTLGFGIGITLGLLGGGGSILTVPALVYLIGLTPQVAVTTSLAVVGANSALGAVFHHAHGTLNWRVALIFGGTGMFAAYFAARLSQNFSADVLMVAFAMLMLVVGLILVFSKTEDAINESHLAMWKIVGSGLIVGVLTGVLGVGGGFLIVPALVMLVGLPFHHAIGTSLVIIAMNSAAGFIGHLSGDVLNLSLITTFVIAGVAGTYTGARLGNHLDSHYLRRMFAAFVIVLALFLLYDNVPKLFLG